MGEFRGSKGPWEILEDDSELKVIQSGSVESGSGWRSYAPICEEVSGMNNARLIAAAPELLEVCLRIQAQFRQAGIESKAGSMNPAEDSAAQIDAVILKALGQ